MRKMNNAEYGAVVQAVDKLIEAARIERRRERVGLECGVILANGFELWGWCSEAETRGIDGTIDGHVLRGLRERLILYEWYHVIRAEEGLAAQAAETLPERGDARLAEKAAENLAKWGMQDFETLGLAVAEEAGELAQAILQYLHEGGDRGRIMEEAVDLGALCLQVMAHFSVEHGGAAAAEGAPAGDVRFESPPACEDYLREAMDYIIDQIGWADKFPRQCHDRIRKVCEAVKRSEPLPFKPDRPACAASNT